jgi:ubiquinone/menaquinone biosynthesis C-methylase UbiE
MPATDSGVFGRFARTYNDTVNSAIGASGEDVSFFARLKAELARATLAASPADLLDFGCGVGETIRELRTVFPATSITGCDASTQSIAIAREQVGEDARLRFAASPDQWLPFDDEQFDAIVASCVLHHIGHAAHGHWIGELRRVLRPGGAVLVFEHNPYNPLTRRVVKNCPLDDGVVLLRAGYTSRLLRRSGLRPSSPHYYFFFPHALRALRRVDPWLRRVPVGAQYLMLGRRPAMTPPDAPRA